MLQNKLNKSVYVKRVLIIILTFCSVFIEDNGT